MTAIKLSKATYNDFATCIDLYNAEVDNGEWQADLFYVSAKSNGSSRSDYITINGVEGANMVLQLLVGEIEHCMNSMCEDGSYSEHYGEAYRAKRRLQKLKQEVQNAFPEAKAGA